MKSPTRLTPAELAAIERHAKRGPIRAEVSSHWEYTIQLHKDVLRLLAEIREPRQERL